MWQVLNIHLKKELKAWKIWRINKQPDDKNKHKLRDRIQQFNLTHVLNANEISNADFLILHPLDHAMIQNPKQTHASQNLIKKKNQRNVREEQKQLKSKRKKAITSEGRRDVKEMEVNIRKGINIKKGQRRSEIEAKKGWWIDWKGKRWKGIRKKRPGSWLWHYRWYRCSRLRAWSSSQLGFWQRSASFCSFVLSSDVLRNKDKERRIRSVWEIWTNRLYYYFPSPFVINI